MKLDTIFADFNNIDKAGRIRLTPIGSKEDIKEKGIELRNGLHLILDDNDEFSAIGIVEYSEEEQIWVAKINWDEIRKKN